MVDYQEMYLIMFRSAEKARRILLEGEISMETAYTAVRTLEEAQLMCEELFINASDE